MVIQNHHSISICIGTINLTRSEGCPPNRTSSEPQSWWAVRTEASAWVSRADAGRPGPWSWASRGTVYSTFPCDTSGAAAAGRGTAVPASGQPQPGPQAPGLRRPGAGSDSHLMTFTVTGQVINAGGASARPRTGTTKVRPGHNALDWVVSENFESILTIVMLGFLV